jgi:Tetracyclin repressor-like, C-terminal domain
MSRRASHSLSPYLVLRSFIASILRTGDRRRGRRGARSCSVMLATTAAVHAGNQPGRLPHGSMRKVAALMTAQDAGRVGRAFPPGFLLTAIMALATAWTAPNPYGPSLDPNAHKHLATLRRNIAEAVRLLSESKTTSRMRN